MGADDSANVVHYQFVLKRTFDILRVGSAKPVTGTDSVEDEQYCSRAVFSGYDDNSSPLVLHSRHNGTAIYFDIQFARLLTGTRSHGYDSLLSKFVAP